jgi:hypothetical protein
MVWVFGKLAQYRGHRHADAGGVHLFPSGNELTKGNGFPIGLTDQLRPG